MYATPPKDLLKALHRIERRIEATAIEEPRSGFFRNMYGTYDREDLTSQLLELHAQIRSAVPENRDMQYVHAGALMRASRFDEAKELYASVAEWVSSAHLMMAMIELNFGDRVVAEGQLSRYNERAIADGMPFMVRSLEQIRLRRDEGSEISY